MYFFMFGFVDLLCKLPLTMAEPKQLMTFRTSFIPCSYLVQWILQTSVVSYGSIVILSSVMKIK